MEYDIKSTGVPSHIREFECEFMNFNPINFAHYQATCVNEDVAIM